MMTELNSAFKVKEYILKQIKEQSLKPVINYLAIYRLLEN